MANSRNDRNAFGSDLDTVEKFLKENRLNLTSNRKVRDKINRGLILAATNGDLIIVDTLLGPWSNPNSVQKALTIAEIEHALASDENEQEKFRLIYAKLTDFLSDLNEEQERPSTSASSSSVTIPSSRNKYVIRLEAIAYTGDIPEEYICPISREIMENPITIISNGIPYSFDKRSLQGLFGIKNTAAHPITRELIDRKVLDLPIDQILKDKIENFVKKLAPAVQSSSQTSQKLFAAAQSQKPKISTVKKPQL